MPKGLLNPKNAAADTGGPGFKEGPVRVDSSVFRVHKQRDPNVIPKDYVPRIVVALVWDVTRLDQNMEPMTDEHDNPLTEQLVFPLGGKSLAQVHPGKAETPDDDESEDLGDAVNTEGNTIFMVNSNFQIHPKSSVHYLFKSLIGKVDEKLLDRVWAPDWVGMVAFLKNEVTADTIKGDDGKERPISYKVVEKVIRMGTGKKAAGAAAGAGKAAAGGDKANEFEAKIAPILEAISTEADGTQLTFKALNTRVGTALKTNGVDPKAHVNILALLKDQTWMEKNAKKFDMTLDFEERTVIFGTPPEAA